MTADVSDRPDPTSLGRFLEHLEPRDVDAAALARELLDHGWPVASFVGPVQMDVWELTLSSGEWTVRFGVERGRSDGVIATRAQGTPDEERLRLGSWQAARAWLDSLPS